MRRSRFDLHAARPASLLADILGRDRSLFAEDLARHHSELMAVVGGSRILVVGAGGSIGAAFVRELARYRPAVLHLVDINENSLVEAIRDLRSGPDVPEGEIASFSVDFSQPEFTRLHAFHGPYDYFLNFSALKHVRAERDPFSLMRMLDVNVRALWDFLEGAQLKRAFSVSTDKSVRPANLMGASKHLMEKALFARDGAVATSARFANVAFSAGSLLESFGNRLAKGQPIAATADVRRYFISHEEAGQLCLLAAFLGGCREVFIPRLDAAHDTKTFAEIAEIFLRHSGFATRRCHSEDEARQLAARGDFQKGWPCFFHDADTTGEKDEEEFCRRDDVLDTRRFQGLAVVCERVPDRLAVAAFMEGLARLRTEPKWDKQTIVDLIAAFVSDLQHKERHRSLDERM
jgi:FlaA1/EpsC-like NDP-sugar epimerase